MSEDDMEQARKAHEREAYNPYSREKMGAYLNRLMGEKAGIESDALPLESKRDLLCSLSAVAYGRENGFSIRLLDGYVETNGMLLRRFEIVREDGAGDEK